MSIVNLALQGGGSHGAFTWGVLDALLQDGRIGIEGLSGASAGAVNAVALASGWAVAEAAGRDPHEGARAALADFWNRVSGWGSLGAFHQAFARFLGGGLALSPYQANPLGLNPLRDLLERAVDFDAIAAHPRLKVFVSATQVTTGKAVVFTGRRLDAAAVLASACLPLLFQAVEIDGEAYWDGGYSVNPALAPLVDACQAADLLLVQINPVTRPDLPRTTADILDRASELTFNASLLTQVRAIAFVNRLVEQGVVTHPAARAVRIHRIDGGTTLAAYPASSRSSPDAVMLHQLFDAGRQAGGAWLARHFDALGRHGTVDLRRDYLDDTWLELAPSGVEPPRSTGRGFRRWLQRMLRPPGA